MKKILSLLALVYALFLGSCVSTDTPTPQCQFIDQNIIAPAAETAQVEAYLTAQGLLAGATKHPSGFYYKIDAPGSGDRAGLCSQIGILYKGMLTNGTVFDQTSGTNVRVFQLGQLIVGWQKGIPLIKKDGKIKLYIPPSLGYGNRDIKDQSGNTLIPANSILIFEVDLRVLVV